MKNFNSENVLSAILMIMVYISPLALGMEIQGIFSILWMLFAWLYNAGALLCFAFSPMAIFMPLFGKRDKMDAVDWLGSSLFHLIIVILYIPGILSWCFGIESELLSHDLYIWGISIAVVCGTLRTIGVGIFVTFAKIKNRK